MSHQAPTGPLVELGLVGQFLFLGRPSRGRRQIVEVFGRWGEKSCPSMRSASPEKGLLPRWCVTGWKVWLMPPWARGCTVVARLAERVPGVPDHIGELLTILFGLKQGRDDGSTSVGACRNQIAGRDHSGDFGSQGGPVDVVGPAHISGLDPEVEFVTNIGTCRSAVGGRAVSGPGSGVHGVLLATIGSDAQDLGPASRRLFGLGTPLTEKLRLGGLTVELDGHRLAVEGTPGLDVGPVDRHRVGDENIGWNSGPGQLVWQTTGRRLQPNRTRAPGTASRRVVPPGDRTRPDPSP